MAPIMKRVENSDWQRIEGTFHAALEVPAAERSPLIERLLADAPALIPEVEKLLRSESSSEQFIEASVWTDSRFLSTKAKKEISNSMSDAPPADPTSNLHGRRIGVFRLAGELGRGGMGSVYLGERADGEFEQRVAVKLIRKGMDSDFIIRRFRHERQILASFDHPYIARLLDGGTTEEGLPYFVMEYVDGETLYNYCDSRTLSIEERLRIFLQICSAVEYAHGRQIIHRDIKPGNVLINKAGVPKLLDFGIAKILDPELIHESVNPTASMLRMMTPDYSSPEQVQGEEVTPASDIYSLGVLLYEVLTGHKPYSFSGRALHEVSRVICEVMPELPSGAVQIDETLLTRYNGDIGRAAATRKTTIDQLRETLRNGLDDIVMKALAKRPEDRYESAADFAADIERSLSGSEISAPKYSQKRLSETTSFLRRAEATRSIAVLPFKFINLGPASDTDHSFLGLGLADAMITRLSKVRRLTVRPTSSILAFSQEQPDPVKAGEALGVEFIIDGSIKQAGDRLRVNVQLLSIADNATIWATSIDETLSDVLTLEDTISIRVLEAILPQISGAEFEELAKRGTENPEAFENYLRGRYHFNSFTEEGFAQAFVSFHKAIAADPDYALAYTGIADYYAWLGIIGVLPPNECFQPGIAAAQKAVELDPQLSEANATLGFCLHAGNLDWSKAETYLLKALELNPANAKAHVWYSIVLFTEGRFSEALQFAERGAELDPLTPFNHHNIAWGLYYGRRFPEARIRYEKVVRDFPGYGLGHYGLSKVLRALDEPRRALEESEKAIALMGDGLFAKTANVEALAVAGRDDEAREAAGELEELAGKRYVSPYQLALGYVELGEHEKAIEKLQDALDSREAWLNWLGVEPAFDPIRSDSRFDEILEKTGYRMLFKRFSESGYRLGHDTDGSLSRNEEKTTLVISDGPDTAGMDTTRTKNGGFPSKVAAAFAGLLILAGIGYFVLPVFFGSSLRGASERPFTTPTIVVLPFRTVQDDKFNLGVGLADALTHKLGNIKGLQVISANTARTMNEDDLTAITSTGADFFVKGELSVQNGVSTLRAEMINTASGSSVLQETFAADETGLFSLQTELAERISTTLGIEPLALERYQVEKSYTENPDAYEFYLIGRYQLTRRSAADLRQAITTFGLSLAKDGNFALAYVGMAEAYLLLKLYDTKAPADSYEKAREYVDRALSIDDGLAEAHSADAYLKFYSARDRQGAELAYRRAIQLNPSLSQAHHWFALFLSATGKHVEAAQEIENARKLDPRSPAVRSASAMASFYARDYEGAIRETNSVLTEEPSFIPALKVKRWTASAMNDIPLSQAVFRKEINYGNGELSDPSWLLIELQTRDPQVDREASVQTLSEVAANPVIAGNAYAFAYEEALAFIHYGVADKALDALERAESASSHGINFLEVDPRFDAIRNEARFQRLLNKLKSRAEK